MSTTTTIAEPWVRGDAGTPDVAAPRLFVLRGPVGERRVWVRASCPVAAAVGAGAVEDEAAQEVPVTAALRLAARWVLGTAVGSRERRVFFAEMARCLGSGLPEGEALRLCIPLARSAMFRGVLGTLVVARERRGVTLGRALEDWPSVFDRATVHLVKSGEACGRQVQIFAALAAAAQRRGVVRSRLAAALAGPALAALLLAAALVTLHFVTFPQVRAGFERMQVELPVLTRVVLGISGLVHAWPALWCIPVLGACGLAVAGRPALRALREAHGVWNLPLVGPLVRDAALARGLRTLGLLLDSGVPRDRAYALAGEASGHPVARSFFQDVADRLRLGAGEAQAFLAARAPLGGAGRELAARVRVAVRSGDLPACLATAAEACEGAATARAELLPRIVNPVAVIAVTAVLGVVIFAVYLPNFRLLTEALRTGALR